MATPSPATSPQTVLITGASSGIGFELARCFARDGHRLILTALFQHDLDEATDRLRQEFPQVQILNAFAMDLARPDAAFEVFRYVGDHEVDILVNDAGFGECGKFVETDLSKELAMIQLNIASLVTLSKLFLRQMVARGAGRVLQLGSVAGFQPGPLLAVYSATKAFVNSFTEAVQNELEGTGVTMTLLCPPATATNFFKVANMQDTKEVQEGKLRPAEDVAKDGYEGLMSGTARVMSGPQAKMQPFLASIMPDSMLASQMRKRMEPADKHHDDAPDKQNATGPGGKKMSATKDAPKANTPAGGAKGGTSAKPANRPKKADTTATADKTAVARPAGAPPIE